MREEKANELAKLCGIPTHPNPSVTLSAVNKYINQAGATAMETDTEGVAEAPRHGPSHFKLRSFPPGCAPTGNEKVDDAIRVLRLLHVHRQRHMQTQINEILCKVQNITGDPKVDLKIGRVGR